MATKKPSTTTKASAKKPAAKKTVAKSTAKKSTAATTKKTPVVKKVASPTVATKKKTTSKDAASKLKSFKVTNEQLSFMSSRITKQTVYWSILLIFILVVALWILNIQLDILEMLDEISQTEV